MNICQFQQKIHNFYEKNKRDFAWRKDITPYKILVSEIMLQQTQTARVVHKFEQWMNVFPDMHSLASASTHQVLSVWQGLGYNRRGVALHLIVQQIMNDFGGILPDSPEILQRFSGIGPNTAGSICAFAFNLPVVFIETNIRTIFLHEFFYGEKNISDKQLLPLIAQTLDKKNPREWYYALMDYGVFLKKEYLANNKSSKHYVKQSKFIGSKRQIRGAIIRALTKNEKITEDELVELIQFELPDNQHDIFLILNKLISEKIVHEVDGMLRL